MFKYKFLNLLETFSDAEFKTFGKFIKSPFFNESKKLVDFYYFLKKFFNSHSFEKITLEMIHENVFREEKYNYIKTRKLLSDFTFGLESFLVHNSIEKDRTNRKIVLANEYKKKIPGKYFENEIGKLKKNLFESSVSSKNFYMSNLYLAEEQFKTKKYTLHSEVQIKNIIEIYKSAKRLNLLERLNVYHFLIQNNISDDEEFVKSGFQSLSDFIRDIGKEMFLEENTDKGMYLYYLVLLQIRDKKISEIFKIIEKYIIKNEKFIKKQDIEFIMNTILIYIINEINRGRYNNYSLLIDNLKKIDEKGYFDDLIEVNHINFVEIVYFSILLKDNEFAESFIWKYFSKINIFYKEDSLNLALAVLRYGQKRYGEVRRQLEKIKYRSYGFYLIAKSLLLRIYYEENSLNYILPLVDSFKHFLKRNKMVPQYFRESFSLFLSYLSKLTSIKKGNMKDVFRIENKIAEEKNFYGKEWLEEKLRIINSEL
jgi:hypothetical protein